MTLIALAMIQALQVSQGMPVGTDQPQTYGSNSNWNEQDELPSHTEPLPSGSNLGPAEHLTMVGPNTYANDDGETFVFPNMDENPPRDETSSAAGNRLIAALLRRTRTQKIGISSDKRSTDTSVGITLGKRQVPNDDGGGTGPFMRTLTKDGYFGFTTTVRCRH